MKGPPPLPKFRPAVATARLPPLPKPSPYARTSSHGSPPGPLPDLEVPGVFEVLKVESVQARGSRVPVAREGMDCLREPRLPRRVPEPAERAARTATLAASATCVLGLLGAFALHVGLLPAAVPARRPTPGSAELLPRPGAVVHPSPAAQAPRAVRLHDATLRPSAPEEAGDRRLAPEDGEVRTQGVRGPAKRTRPGRADVREALRGVAPNVAACIPAPRGVAKVKLTLSGATGRVVQARVLSKADGGLVACINHELARFSVPPFGARTSTVRHTFRR